MTTVTHATAVTGSDNPAYQVSKDEWNVGHTVVDDLKLAVLDLSSAQIKALFTTPIQIIAAPGAGLVINVLSATMQLDFLTTAYSAGGSMRFVYGSTAGVEFAVSLGVGYKTAQDAFLTTGPASDAITTAVTNQPLSVSTETPNPTLGDGTVRITVRYTIEAWA